MSDETCFAVSSLDYVRMHVEVAGWVAEAADADERERLSELACFYLNSASDTAEQERERRLRILPGGIRRWLQQPGSDDQCPVVTASGYEAIRQWAAVTPVGSLEVLHYREMQDLADMFEGWAQDPDLCAVDAARFMGMADGKRALAEAAGPGWRRSLLTFLARRMRAG